MVQPFVHQLSCVLRAPVQVWTAADGQSDGTGAQGIYLADERVVSRARLTAHGHVVEDVGHRVAGSEGVFETILRTPYEGADPVVSMTRTRRADAGGVSEEIRLASAGELVHRVRISLELVPDHAPLELIKAGKAEPAPAVDIAPDATWSWRAGTWAKLTTDGELHPEDVLRIDWDVTLVPGQVHELGWRLDLAADDLPFVAPELPSLERPVASRPDLDRLLTASRADLEALLLCEPSSPQWSFAAAGAPWFLTLFGRDSLITATMLARTNPGLALGTLKTLAARLGTTVDESRAEAPGKVLHEVRRVSLDLQDDATVLPPEYYGTIDATLLWTMLLGEVTDAGVDPGDLLDPLVRTLGWLRDHADPDGDGFLEYFDTSGHGLANQGWKDSGDSIRFADGTIAEGPIVLLEVQGYAYSAARAGARILAAHGRNDAERAAAAEWDRYADDMAQRIRERFWVSDEAGPYPAIALDHEKQPVTGVASNMGHLLGTGVLTAEEERLVVDRLVGPEMFSGYGIRTMSTANGAYWPWRYHVGSVWTHDTAWILRGMHRAGFVDESLRVAEGLLRALDGFANRAPELFGGQSSDEGWPPLPYPASCRPQAWAAASAWVLAEVLGE